MHKCTCLLYLAVIDDFLYFSILPLGKLILREVLGQSIGHGLDRHHRVLAHQIPVGTLDCPFRLYTATYTLLIYPLLLPTCVNTDGHSGGCI